MKMDTCWLYFIECNKKKQDLIFNRFQIDADFDVIYGKLNNPTNIFDAWEGFVQRFLAYVNLNGLKDDYSRQLLSHLQETSVAQGSTIENTMNKLIFKAYFLTIVCTFQIPEISFAVPFSMVSLSQFVHRHESCQRFFKRKPICVLHAKQKKNFWNQ